MVVAENAKHRANLLAKLLAQLLIKNVKIDQNN